MHQRLAWLACLALLNGCVSRHQLLPQRSAPSVSVPAELQDPGPLKPGHGRVILDTLGTRAQVVEALAHYSTTSSFYGMGYGYRYYGWPMRGTVTQSADQSRFVCITPCVVDLPLGDHELTFLGRNTAQAESDTLIVRATATPQAYRLALTRETPPGALYGVGEVSSVMGISATILGALLYAAAPSVEGDDQRRTGLTLGGIGLGLFGVGLTFQLTSQGELTPGNAISFGVRPKAALDPAAPP